MHPSPLEELSV